MFDIVLYYYSMYSCAVLNSGLRAVQLSIYCAKNDIDVRIMLLLLKLIGEIGSVEYVSFV